MCMVCRFAYLRHEFQALAGVQLVLGGMLQQRCAAYELHCKIRLQTKSAICSSGFVDLGNAGVMQLAECLGLPLKAPEHLVAGQATLDDLECNRAAGVVLLSLIHHAHTTFPNQPANPVSPHPPPPTPP